MQTEHSPNPFEFEAVARRAVVAGLDGGESERSIPGAD